MIPQSARFISADTFATTDVNGFLSCNMFAYCENDPVIRYDPTGDFFFTVLGAAVGFISGGVTALATGSSLDKAFDKAIAGAAGGAIAGGGVDLALLVLGTGGVAAPFVAAGVAYGLGGAGNLLTTYLCADGEKLKPEEVVGSFIIGGSFNLISLATGLSCISNKVSVLWNKGMGSLKSNALVGSAIALSTSIATELGTKASTSGNKVKGNKPNQKNKLRQLY